MKPFTPIQYIIGKTEFCGLDLAVNEDVLIPRPETELLAQAAIDLSDNLRLTTCGLKILDLCTGSGCIAVSIAHSLFYSGESLTKDAPDCKIVASDISEKALDVARSNARRHGVSDRIDFVNSDLFDNIEGKFDIIVSNPPYIAKFEFDTLQKEVLREPRMALDGGNDGLDFYRRIAREAPRHLRPGGSLLFEIGFGQAEEIKDIIGSGGAFKVVDLKKDFNKIDRVIIAKWIN